MSRYVSHHVVTLHEQEPQRTEWGGFRCRLLDTDHPTEWFEASGLSTRNGQGFGSADVRVKAPTLESALAELDARIERARKVAVRKFAAPVPA
jgi:hypothetical protein